MKRFAYAVLIAALLAAGPGRLVGAVVPSICSTLAPSDWFWRWFYGCDKADDGGGNGAGGW